MPTDTLTMQSELEGIERKLWDKSNDPTTYDQILGKDALCVIDQMGVVDRDSVVKMTKEAKPWTDVKITDSKCLELGPNCAALVYQADAVNSETKEPYSAQISSVYAKEDGNWKLKMTNHVRPAAKETA